MSITNTHNLTTCADIINRQIEILRKDVKSLAISESMYASEHRDEYCICIHLEKLNNYKDNVLYCDCELGGSTIR
jgi:hypothetical protein